MSASRFNANHDLLGQFSSSPSSGGHGHVHTGSGGSSAHASAVHGHAGSAASHAAAQAREHERHELRMRVHLLRAEIDRKEHELKQLLTQQRVAHAAAKAAHHVASAKGKTTAQLVAAQKRKAHAHHSARKVATLAKRISSLREEIHGLRKQMHAVEAKAAKL